MIKRFFERVKTHFRNVLELKVSPSQVAFGFSVGTFFAHFPTFGLEFLFIFLLLFVFRKLSKVGIVFAYLVWNPLITYPLGLVGFLIGNVLLKETPKVLLRFGLFNEVFSFSLRYLLGNFIIGLTAAIISYPIVYYSLKKYQEKN